jgi:hypothetical protein
LTSFNSVSEMRRFLANYIFQRMEEYTTDDCLYNDLLFHTARPFLVAWGNSTYSTGRPAQPKRQSNNGLTDFFLFTLVDVSSNTPTQLLVDLIDPAVTTKYTAAVSPLFSWGVLSSPSAHTLGSDLCAGLTSQLFFNSS